MVGCHRPLDGHEFEQDLELVMDRETWCAGEMVGWHHRLDGHGFGWTPRVGDGQGGLACCSS